MMEFATLTHDTRLNGRPVRDEIRRRLQESQRRRDEIAGIMCDVCRTCRPVTVRPLNTAEIHPRGIDRPAYIADSAPSLRLCGGCVDAPVPMTEDGRVNRQVAAQRRWREAQRQARQGNVEADGVNDMRREGRRR
jgi:hypothetical protein